MNIKTNALFLSNYNKRISATSIRRIVKVAYLLSNIDNNTYSVHTLRHTFTTRMYEAGVNIKAMQEILGHADAETTMDIYAEATRDLKKSEIINFDNYFNQSKAINGGF